MKKKVAMVTWHYYSNFGSALQAYALQTQLENIGCKPKLIDYRNKKYGVISPLREHILYILSKIFSKRFQYPFICFRKENLHLSRLTQDEKRLAGMVKTYDAVICGSDQIWAPNVLNTVYLLDFVPGNIPKISYAASVGLDNIPDDMVDIYKGLLSRFSDISVRETAGAELLDYKCGIKAKTVLDPTLLIHRDYWEKIEKKPCISVEKYIFCYFLNKNHTYQKSVAEYARKHNLKIIGCSSRKEDVEWMESPVPKAGPREFLWLVHHAECVFTDSYHCTIFSLIFHKDFIVFERFLSTDKVCQNSRIYQLDRAFGIGRCIVRVSDETLLSMEKYDYNKFEEILSVLRKESNEYLSDALGCY